MRGGRGAPMENEDHEKACRAGEEFFAAGRADTPEKRAAHRAAAEKLVDQIRAERAARARGRVNSLN